MYINEIVGDFRFRRIEKHDKYLFMSVRSDTSDVAEFYRRYPDVLKRNWDLILKNENDVHMMVFQQPDSLFVGTCSFQGVRNKSLELGYGIVKELRGKGIGTRMAGAIFEFAHKHFPGREIIVRIREDNAASWRVAEKNGAEFVRMDDPPEVATLQKLLDENGDLPNSSDARAIIEQIRNSVRVYRV